MIKIITLRLRNFDNELLELIYNCTVQIQHVVLEDLLEAMDDRDEWQEI